MTASPAVVAELRRTEASEDETPDTQHSLEEAVLARLAPDGISSGEGWRERKSARTRIAVLEAAMRCLAEMGYAAATTKVVAEMAEVSRGAMLHHYPTKIALIEQVAAYTFFKRMEQNFRDFARLTPDERMDENLVVGLYWKNLHTLEYRAYLELVVAARSDVELQRIIEPKALEFERVQIGELPKVFPEWAEFPEQLKLANDLVISAMDGLLLNSIKWQDPARTERLRRLVGMIVHQLRTGNIEAEGL